MAGDERRKVRGKRYNHFFLKIFKKLKRTFLSPTLCNLTLSCILELHLPSHHVYQHPHYQHIPRGNVAYLKPLVTGAFWEHLLSSFSLQHTARRGGYDTKQSASGKHLRSLRLNYS